VQICLHKGSKTLLLYLRNKYKEMNRFIRPILLSIITILILPTERVSAQTFDFKTGRSIEVQFNVLRELSLLYVDSVNVEKLVKTGVDAMLASLDPYTTLIPAEESESVELMRTGSYGGVGAIIRASEEGILVVEPYENSPAAKAGLISGDIILKVDTMATKGLSADEASTRMKGIPGTSVTFSVKRLRSGAIETIEMIREKIHTPDVSYSGVIADTIGYMRVSNFTMGGSKDVRRDFINLKNNYGIKRLIIDLRGNGGGILDEAVGLVSLFVPRGTKVLSSRGKLAAADMDYYTDSEPVDLEIPLIVLVNSRSASSSEIVAGALQDLDRAVIMGTRTFGKGLVQSIRDVEYGNILKITTAKYYTPSGRCVQAIDYSNRNEDGSVGHIPDSLIKAFKTSKGRTVYDGGGVTPDVAIASESYDRLLISLIYNEILYDYSVQYFREHLSIVSPTKFVLSDKEYEEFVTWAVAKEFDSRTASEVEFDRLVSIAKGESLYDNMKEEFDAMEKKVKMDKKAVLIANKDDIKAALEEEICVRYYFQRGSIESMLRNDKQLLKAIEENYAL